MHLEAREFYDSLECAFATKPIVEELQGLDRLRDRILVRFGRGYRSQEANLSPFGPAAKERRPLCGDAAFR